MLNQGPSSGARNDGHSIEALISRTPLIVLGLDSTGSCIAVGGGGSNEYGVDPNNVIGHPATDIFADREPLIRAFKRAAAGEPSMATSDSSGRLIEVHCFPTDSTTPSAVTVVLIDGTKRAAANDRLRRQLAAERLRARTDALTRTLNHASILDTLRESLSKRPGRPHVLAMVDVDGLKAVNDTWGHVAGDALLVRVAESLQRDGATVGRYGGDEFVVVLAGADLQAGESYRRDVLAALRQRALLDPGSGARLPVAITVGLSIYPDEATRAEDLLRLADSAMYALRTARRGRRDNASRERLDSESASRLVGEIVPLLTSVGTREAKLRLVANQLAAGAGYDAVNFEVSGGGAPATWETTLLREGSGDLEAWTQEQSNSSDHPLGRLMEERRAPVFIDSLASTELMTKRERDLVLSAGFGSTLIVPMIWHDRLVGMLSVGSKEEAAFTPWDAQFLTAVSSQVTAIVFMTTIVEDLQRATARLERAHSETVIMLAGAAEAHDQTTGRHLQRVRGIAEAIALELGYGSSRANEIATAAVLHDIGKIRVPDAILTSPGGLDDGEWALMRQHTAWGSDFLAGRDGFELASIVARCHHERWDGAGYPQGLRGDDIPEAAAITTVADSLDAMTNDRPYRAGRPTAEAMGEIVACSGSQFSPRVVAALVRLYRRGDLPVGLNTRDERAA